MSFKITGKYTSAFITIDNVEESCVSQIYGFVNHPAFTNPVAIMPDCHAGKGSVIGFTMPLTQKVIPNVIGVDIGCGMLTIDLGNKLPISLEQLDKSIREKVPFGMNSHDNAVINFKKEFPWKEVRDSAKNFAHAYNKIFNDNITPEIYEEEDKWFHNKCDLIHANSRRVINSAGSLGGGNHFCEIGQSEDGRFWLTIHTGSRNFGKCICDYWQHYAIKIVRKEKEDQLKEEIAKIRKVFTGNDIEKEIVQKRKQLGLDATVSQELAYLEGNNAIGYLFDMIFAQMYAQVNRRLIAKIIMDIIDPSLKFRSDCGSIESVHNFIDFRDFIVRKGAIRSYTGEQMIIPFNMRDGILICEGKSNAEWNFSAPHGAGRVLSRTAAKGRLDLNEFKKSMEGIYSTSVGRGTLDESPMAYKDSKMIEEAIEPTAKILMRIKPILNMKDSEGRD